ncbi:DctP family TRAP transporter solute-binding subunit [Peribacillus acanthi]|uniref:DctP family TRAP transporter solute-binding subunit n=1 Tax=Peribacillus acanthi TaxID=2171554 RepID=UPI000D3EAC20|nr:DctP family TRAP transporter solute-binding subunit [Peribacillus acanthi]
MRKPLMMVMMVIALIGMILTGCKDSETASTKEPASKPASGTKTNKDAVVIRYAHFQPAGLDQPKQAAALAFESYVESHTNGEVQVEIYPASQLGDADTVLEGLKLGSIQMGVVHDGPISSLYPPMGVYNMPFLFKNQGEAWSVFDGDYTKNLAEDMKKQTGIRLLGLADNGIRQFTNSKKEIKSVADMKGLKMRVQPSPLYEKLVQGTGASPSAIAWTELPTALQQKVVDGQENGVTNILAASLFQTQKHVTLSNHVYSFHAYMISDAFFSKLTQEQQKVVQEGVDIAKWIHRGMTANQDMNAGAILSEKGMKVTTLTPEAVEEFRQATQPAVADWMKETVGEKWVEDLLAEVEALRNE